MDSMADTRLPTLWQAIMVWLRIGVLSFGGPAAQIALMHKVVVDEKRWLTEKEYLNALSSVSYTHLTLPTILLV